MNRGVSLAHNKTIDLRSWLNERGISLEQSFYERMYDLIQEYNEAHSITLTEACAAFGVSHKAFYNWCSKGKGLISDGGKCIEIAKKAGTLLALTDEELEGLLGKAGFVYYPEGYV